MTDYIPQFNSSSTGPAALKFVQIVQVGSGEDCHLVGLTREGEIFWRLFNEAADVFVWHRAPAFSSTELVGPLTCSACGETFTKGFPHERCTDCRKGTLVPDAGRV